MYIVPTHLFFYIEQCVLLNELWGSDSLDRPSTSFNLMGQVFPSILPPSVKHTQTHSDNMVIVLQVRNYFSSNFCVVTGTIYS